MAVRFLVGRALLVGSLLLAGTFIGVFVPKVGLSLRSSDGTAGELSAAGILERQLRLVKGTDSEKELNLHHAAGKIYFSQGRYGDAVDHYTQARVLADGFDEKDVARVLHARGEAWLGLGHYEMARSDLEEANAKVGGKGDASILRCLGNVHREMGHINSALELYQQALAADGVPRPLLLADIGEAHARRGEIKEAEVALLEAVRLQEDDSSSGVRSVDSDTAVISTSLGFLHHVQGDVNGAVAMYRQSLKLQRSLRPDHPEIVATRLGHARAVRDLGDISVALQMVEQLEWIIHTGAQEGPDLSRVLMLKAELLRQQDLQEEAHQVAEEVLALQSIVFMEEAPDMAVTHIVLGNILHDKGQLKEALKMYRKALDLNMKTVGEDHPETAAALISIGTLCGDMGRSRCAETNLKKGLDVQLRTLGAKSPDVGITHNNLAMVMFKQGHVEEAGALLRKAIGIVDAAGVPESHPDRKVYMKNLSKVQESAQEDDLVHDSAQAVSV